MQTHKSLAAAVDTLNLAYPPPATPHRFITLSTMEPGHIGNTAEVLMSLRHRQRLLISTVRDPSSVLQLIRTHKVNGSFLGPLAVNDISLEATREDLASLKLAWTGSGVVPEPILAAFLEKLPDDADFYFGYGSTE
jgi:acyl-CoA synthetase (AMP-forming)/AMP-acid ligase II